MIEKHSLYIDWPTRVLHWSLVIGFLFTIGIAQFVDDDSKVFTYHMIGGVTLSLIVILRVLWGIIGPNYANFRNFQLSPAKLKQYLQDVLNGSSLSNEAHNPASSWAAMLMFILILSTASIGILMATTTGAISEVLEEIHELSAMLLTITVIIHIGGVIFHQMKKQDNLLKAITIGTQIEQDHMGKKPKSFIFLGIILFGFIFFSFSFMLKKIETNPNAIDIGVWSIPVSSEKEDSEYDDHDHHD